MPDPRLKIAAAEIEAILRAHDIAGVVLIASPTHTEYLLKIDPSWSCCWIEDAPGGKAIRVRSKLAEYPDKAAQKKKMEDTTGLLMGFIDCGRDVLGNLERVVGLIGQKMEITHTSRHEPPTQDN